MPFLVIPNFLSRVPQSLPDVIYVVISGNSCLMKNDYFNRFMLQNNNLANSNPATVIFTLPIHYQGVDPYRCGAMRPGDMLRALSFVFAIQRLVGYRRYDLRTLVLDNCNNVLRIDQDLFNILSKGTLCNAEFNITDGTTVGVSNVVAVHTLDSRFVVAANRITAPMHIQLTSSYATSDSLSDVRVYPYFARTVPPDTVQMEVIARILQRNDWSYVSVLYSQEPYGIDGFRTLRDLTNANGYSCIGFSAALRDTTSKPLIKESLARLAEVEGAKVIVLIVADNIRNILESLIEMDMANEYVVIGTDAWGSESQLTTDIWNNFLGAITIAFRDALQTDFLQWMREITYTNRKGIPDSWFDEFYQHIHKCQLPDSPLRQSQYSTVCRTDLVIQPDQIKEYSVGIHDIAAAYAIDQGLGQFRCDGDTFQECMEDGENNRQRLFEYTLAVNWEILSSSLDPESDFTLTLGDKRYWDIGYNIYTIKENNEYMMIGSSGDEFRFNSTLYQTYRDADFTSRCPLNTFCDCAFDGVQPVVIQPVQTNAEPRNYFMYEESTDFEPDFKPLYTWPIWAIAVAVLSCIGIVIGLILFFYFLVAYPVRGGTTVLGFMMMVGVFGIYAINFAFFLPASAATCGAREFVLGIVYAIVFAALLIKAIDDWRFKDYDYQSKQYYRGISNPCLLITLAFGIVLIQCIIPIEWLILRNPSASLLPDHTDRHDWMMCDPHDFYDESLVLSMVFVIFLVVITGIFAALAWNSESNYYESRWIFVACVCTAGCFLVWMVVTTNAGYPYRDPAVAIANFVNASALLILLPMRKLVLLIQYKWEEEKYKVPNGVVETNTGDYSTVYHNQMYEDDNGMIVDGKSLPANEY